MDGPLVVNFQNCFRWLDYHVVCHFVDRCLSFRTCCFGHFVECSSSIYRLWLPFGIFKLWYLSMFRGQCLIEMTSGTMRLCHCIVCHPSIVFSVIPPLYQQREIKDWNCSGNANRSSIIFFYHNIDLWTLINTKVWRCQRVIIICISKKNIQQNGQNNKYERTNNDLQSGTRRGNLVTNRW
jgi:hypothetical protein